jgi:K+-transporting ATPase A subunit
LGWSLYSSVMTVACILSGRWDWAALFATQIVARALLPEGGVDRSSKWHRLRVVAVFGGFAAAVVGLLMHLPAIWITGLAVGVLPSVLSRVLRVPRESRL